MPRNALQTEMRPTPRNPLMGQVAEWLQAARGFGNKAQIPAGVPLLGGQGVGHMVLGQIPEELNEWSYGNAPMRINPLAGRTASYVPEVKPGRKQGFADMLWLATTNPGRNALMAGMGGMMDGGAARAMAAGWQKAGPLLESQAMKPLTEKEFYRRYLQHVDIKGARAGTAEANAESILRDGFKPGINVNTQPPYQGGPPQNVMEQAFGPRAGQTVYLVPKSATRETGSGGAVVAGWKPEPFEVIRPTKDFPSLYEEYLAAIARTAQGGR